MPEADVLKDNSDHSVHTTNNQMNRLSCTWCAALHFGVGTISDFKPLFIQGRTENLDFGYIVFLLAANLAANRTDVLLSVILGSVIVISPGKVNREKRRGKKKNPTEFRSLFKDKRHVWILSKGIVFHCLHGNITF